MKKIKTIFLCSLALIMGCQSTPAKRGTTLDKIRKQVVAGARENININSRKDVPSYVRSALIMTDSLSVDDSKKSVELPKKKFDVTANNVAVGPFFQGLVEGTRLNVVVSPRATGSITLRLKNVTIGDVFDTVYSLYGYEFEKLPNNTIKINPAALQTRIYPVNYIDMKRNGMSQTRVNSSGLDGVNSSSSDDSSSDSTSSDDTSSSEDSSINSKINTTVASDFWSEIENTLFNIVGDGAGRSIVVSPMTGMVTVTAMPEEQRKVEKYLQKSVNSMQRQVILEAKILEVELNDSYRAGINWAQIGRNFAASQIGGDINDSTNITTTMPTAIPKVVGAPTSVTLNNLNPLSAIPSETGAFGGVLNLGVNYGKFTAFLRNAW